MASSEILLLVSAVPSLARDNPADVCVGLCRDVLNTDKEHLLSYILFILSFYLKLQQALESKTLSTI